LTTAETDAGSLGIRHTHDWQTLNTRVRLQSAHDSMRWDVATSRLLSVERCAICDEFRRESAQVCTADACHEHPICERPYR
jgi:hypothetical protein